MGALRNRITGCGGLHLKESECRSISEVSSVHQTSIHNRVQKSKVLLRLSFPNAYRVTQRPRRPLRVSLCLLRRKFHNHFVNGEIIASRSIDFGDNAFLFRTQRIFHFHGFDHS